MMSSNLYRNIIKFGTNLMRYEKNKLLSERRRVSFEKPWSCCKPSLLLKCIKM